MFLVTSEDETEWDGFVSKSPEGSVFSTNLFLKELDLKYKNYWVIGANNQKLAGVSIIEHDGLMAKCPVPFIPYQGFMTEEQISALPRHKRYTKTLLIYEFLISELTRRYTNFSMSLSPYVNDIRAFQWFNYGEINLDQFQITQRSTAILDITNFKLEQYLTEIRSVRRREYNKQKHEVMETNDTSRFMDLYVAMFHRQGIEVRENELERVEQILTSTLKSGIGRLMKSETSEGISGMSHFLYDRNTAYYLLGVSNPVLRSTSSMAALLIENIQYASQIGVRSVDFVGVNSPQRGDFKLSLNPVICSYSQVDLITSA